MVGAEDKYFLGFFLDKELVGVVTLGWGTRPRHTIQRIFPSLETKDYLEIGRMCITEEMPRDSESQMLSQLVKWIQKNIPDLKILFTWDLLKDQKERQEKEKRLEKKEELVKELRRDIGEEILIGRGFQRRR